MKLLHIFAVSLILFLTITGYPIVAVELFVAYVVFLMFRYLT